MLNYQWLWAEPGFALIALTRFMRVAAMLERRNSRRRRVCLEGQVGIDATSSPVTVRVRNLTDHGVEIVVPGGHLAASTVAFKTTRDEGCARTASVVWWRRDRFGLRFDDASARADRSTPAHPWSRYSASGARG